MYKQELPQATYYLQEGSTVVVEVPDGGCGARKTRTNRIGCPPGPVAGAVIEVGITVTPGVVAVKEEASTVLPLVT